MKRMCKISRVVALCGGLMCLTLVNGAGCSLYFGEPDTGTPSTEVPDTEAPNTEVPDTGNNQPNQPDMDKPGGDGTGSPPSGPVWGTAEGGNADGVHGCGVQGDYDHYEHAVSGETQLHVVGVYESGTQNASDVGQVDIHVTRPGTSVLVLSSYEPIVWTVTSAPGVVIERVILNGYGVQEANVPDGVPVEVYTYEQGTGYLGDMGFEWPSYSTSNLIEHAQSHTGLQLTSFRGCYRSNAFQIDEPGEVRPPHPESNSTKPGIITGCEHLAQESSYCLAMGGFVGELFMLGLDSGEICASEGPDFSYITDSSMGWVGDYVYFCTYERGLARVSLLDGTVDIAPVRCKLVTSHQGGLLVVLPNPDQDDVFAPPYLARFDSFAAVVENRPEHVFAIDASATRMGTNGNRVYFSWHSTTSIETTVLVDGAPFTSIELEGYGATPMFGLEVTDDGQMLIGTPNWDGGLHIFDAKTGVFRRILQSAGNTINLNGIECVSGGR